MLLDLNERKGILIASALGNGLVPYLDVLTKGIVEIYGNANILFYLIEKIVEREIFNTASEGTIFRVNSFCTNLLNYCSHLLLDTYINNFLFGPVYDIVQSPISFEVFFYFFLNFFSISCNFLFIFSTIFSSAFLFFFLFLLINIFKVDPHKIMEGENIEENQNNLREATQLFFDTICESIPSVPIEFKKICLIIYNIVSSKFAHVAAIKSVGGIFFLRFICPFLISPASFVQDFPPGSYRTFPFSFLFPFSLFPPPFPLSPSFFPPSSYFLLIPSLLPIFLLLVPI